MTGGLACSTISFAQIGVMDLSRPPRQERSVEVRPTLPLWVAMPREARILTSDGLEMRPLRNSAVTYENAKLGVLVGALVNAGGCARNLTVRLQYTDDHWRPMGDPIENEARVSHVDPGAALPYRFRLRRNDEFAAPPSGYIVQVTEEGKPVAAPLQWVDRNRKTDASPCPATDLVTSITEKRRRATLSGYRVDGMLTVQSGGPVRPDGLMLTALLLDEAGEVLEVLTGIPEPKPKELPTGLIENAHAIPFSLSTGIPLGKAVHTVRFFAELLSDARLAQ
ncbi:hypothetical protein [Luteitalea sp. TBR-22]|uniref:hypothetical protein n=1 Tax=Luteitalea sp. TBR-22 TaxID=2802971 RepID=UPI001EF508C6|nr:hypothetical protein [Luteitalea sp. TBR-22]